MRKYALVNNNIITDIKDLEEDEFRTLSKSNDMIVDIEDMSPQPLLRWVLNGNKFEIPNGNSDREKFEIELASKKTDFGIKLARHCVDRIGARNKILNKDGTQVSAILNSLMPVKLLLETGALGTARYSCTLLKVVYTEYSDIFQYIIDEVNAFELANGL